MPQKPEDNLPKIGYLYHYPQLDHPTDNFRLDIFISSIPTEKHFDVLHAHFSVKTREEGIECLTVTHPWYFEKDARVCAGLVIMEDRKGRKEEAFTFGGQLNIEAKEMQTDCILVSSAPILEITGTSQMHRLFIDELEIVLAKQQAKYPNHHDYETRLSKADPMALYLACLTELINKFEQFPHKDEKNLQFLSFLHSQQHRLEAAGLLTAPLPGLNDIFGK